MNLASWPRSVVCWAVLALVLASCAAVGAEEIEPEDSATEPLDGRDGRPLALEEFRPKSQLRTPNNQPPRAKFPVVDVHIHPRLRFRHVPKRLDEFVEIMDLQNIALGVSLDGRLGDDLEEHKAYLWDQYKDRFLIFANIDWRGAGRTDDPANLGLPPTRFCPPRGPTTGRCQTPRRCWLEGI